MMSDGEAVDLLFELLWDIPVMQSDDSRRSVLEEMRRRGVDLGPSTAANGRLHCAEIISAALRKRGALRSLAEFLYRVDDSALDFLEKVEELLPTDFLSVAERRQLIAELSPYVAQQELITYYRDATSDVAPRQFADLDDLVRELEQVMADEPGHPLVRLAESIADRTRGKRASKAARRWSNLLAQRIDADAVGSAAGAQQRYLAERRKSKAKPLSRKLDRAALVLRLEQSGFGRDHYLFTAWLYLGDSFVDTMYGSHDPLVLDGVRLALIKALEQAFVRADQADRKVRQMDLEFAVPRDLLCYPFEQWTFSEAAYTVLADRFIVVVRDLIRQRGVTRYTGWESKWEHLTQNGHVSPAQIYRWITCADEPGAPGDLYRQLRGDDCVSLGLTFPPRDSPHPVDFAEALDAGTPVAIWPRWCEHTRAWTAGDTPARFAFREELSRRLAGRQLTELPRIVLEMRSEQPGAEQPRAGLTLLWDEPGRWPEPPDFNLDAPASTRGTA